MIGLSGRARSSLIIGLQGIRARKLRTLLSMLSLFLGVLAVVTVQAGGQIAERTMLDNVELTMGKDGTRQMYLPGDATTLPVVQETLTGRTGGVGLPPLQTRIAEPGVLPINFGGQPFDELGPPGSSYGYAAP